MDQFMTLMPLLLLIFIMYFLLIRPQKKREKEVNSMRSALKVGDDIITIGGICGKIVKTKDESLIIQVGADKTKMEVMRWSISKVVSSNANAPSKKSAPMEDKEEPVEEPKKTMPKKLTKATTNSDKVNESEDKNLASNAVSENEGEVKNLDLDVDVEGLDLEKETDKE